MGRYKCRGRLSRDSGFPNKQDTPVKTAPSRRAKCRKLLPNKDYEAFPEEAEVDSVSTVNPTSPALTSIKPVHCKSVPHLSRPALAGSSRGNAVSPAAPANKTSGYRVSPAARPTIQMTPDAEAFKGGGVKVVEEEQNLAVTPGSIPSSSIESETTFNSDDDEEQCYSSATSSSLPSPEIFRKESDVETLTFHIKEELLGLNLHIKNSTLLDVSHARSIHMHHPPNLSNILDASTILAEKTCEIDKHRGPEAETKIHTGSFKSAFKEKAPPKVRKLTGRRPFLYKKKVWFKSPVIAEAFEVKHTPATKFFNASEPVQTSSPAEKIIPDTDTSSAGEINSKEEALRLTVTLKRPVKSTPEKAKFFDFVSDRDRDAFFQRLRERCVKLRSTPLFPLTAAKHTQPSVL